MSPKPTLRRTFTRTNAPIKQQITVTIHNQKNPMKHPFVTAFFAASLATGAALAAEDTATTPEDEEPFTIQTATYADIYDLFEDASPGEGKDAEELENAQDTVLYFVI